METSRWKKLGLSLLALVLLLPCIMEPKLAQAQVTRDKYEHAGTCYGIELTLSQMKPFRRWKPWQRALFTVGVIGGGKEWYDSRHPDKHSAEWGDIAADAVGAMTGEGTLWLIHKSF